VGVVFALEEVGELPLGDEAGDAGEAGLDLGGLCVGALLLGELGEDGEVLGLAEEAVEGFEVALAAADVGVEGGGRGGVLPEVRRGGAGLEVLQLGLALREVKDDPSVLALG